MATPQMKKATSALMHKLSFNREKTFRPKMSFWGGGNASRFAFANQLADNVMGSDLRQAVVCPPDHDLNEWLAVNMVDFFNQINLIYGNVSEFCTKQSCPVMNAGSKYDYLWADGVKVKKPVKCCAPDYVTFLMTWVQGQLDDEELFPRGEDVPFPPKFFEEICKIFKRLFRVYAHIYYSHFKQIENMGADAIIYLNTCYKHFMLFVFRYSLVDRKELEPLAAVTNQLLNADEQISAISTKPVSPTSSELEDNHTSRSARSSVAIQVRAALIGISPNTKLIAAALRKALIVVTVIWIPDDDISKAAAAELSIQNVTSDLDSVFSRAEVDFVFISSAPPNHAAAFAAAMNAGKHVILENPAAMDENEATEIVQLAIKKQQVLDSSSQIKSLLTIHDNPYRFLSTVRKMRALIQSGYIGDVTYVRAQISSSSLMNDKSYGWWSNKTHGGGTLSLDGSHVIDLIACVTLKRIIKASGKLITTIDKRKSIGDELKPVTSDDVAQVHFEMDDGAIGSFVVSNVFAGPNTHVIEVNGTKGMLTINHNTLRGCQLPSTDLVTLLTDTVDDQENKLFASPWSYGVLLLCRGIRAYIAEKDEKLLRDAATLAEGAYVQAVLDCVRRSASKDSGFEPVSALAVSQIGRSQSREDLEAAAQ